MPTAVVHVDVSAQKKILDKIVIQESVFKGRWGGNWICTPTMFVCLCSSNVKTCNKITLGIGEKYFSFNLQLIFTTRNEVFTPVCHSVHGGGGLCPIMHHRAHDQGRLCQGPLYGNARAVRILLVYQVVYVYMIVYSNFSGLIKNLFKATLPETLPWNSTHVPRLTFECQFMRGLLKLCGWQIFFPCSRT